MMALHFGTTIILDIVSIKCLTTPIVLFKLQVAVRV